MLACLLNYISCAVNRNAARSEAPCCGCRAYAAIALTFFIAACGSEQSTAKPSAAARSESIVNASIIPQSEQRPGDPAKGKQALITEPIVSCGIPLSALRQINEPVTHTFPERAGEAASLPYNLNLVEDDNGIELAASNCLTCHAAPLFGELVIGLGNEFLDFSNNASVMVERSGALVSGEHEIAAWEKFADRIAAVAPYMQTQSAGVNPANNLTAALMAHLDPETLEWSDEPYIKPPTTVVPPVSVPPWWRMKKKHAMFWMGEGRGDHASIMMTAAILCADSLDDVQQLDSIAPDIRAYIESIEPPTYPFPVDAVLAAEGQQVFETNCSHCHGTYGDAPTYPNRLVDINVVGTDSSLIDYAFGDGQAYIDWFNQSPYGERAEAIPSRAYVAPPLDGIWATAPFLHNGSVPSIRALLNSQIRPDVWYHTTPDSADQSQYDQNDLGWQFTVVTTEPNDAVLTQGSQWLYDTSRAGYANSGHLFGDALDTAQRNAVLEYLKTL